MIKTTLLSLIEQALNRYLSLDSASPARLKKLEGKVLHIELRPFHLLFQLHIKDKRMTLSTDSLQTPIATIRGTPVQMLGVALNRKERARFFAEDITIEGEAEAANQLIQLFDELSIDWEEPLSKMIGDVPTHHAARIWKNARHWFNQTCETLSDDVNQYVHEETNWLPSKLALADFFNDVDALRMDVDRIDAKIRWIHETLAHDTKDAS